MASDSPNKMLAWLKKIDRVVTGRFLFGGSKILAWVATVAVVLLTLVTVVTVVVRRSPWAGSWLAGGFEISEVLMVVVSICALAYCWYVGGHVRIGLLRDHRGPRVRAIFDAVSVLFGITFVVSLSWGMWELSATSRAFGLGTMVLEIPYAPFELTVVIGMAYFSLVLLRSLIGFIAKAVGRDVEHEGLY